jgi:hypothetical protein
VEASGRGYTSVRCRRRLGVDGIQGSGVEEGGRQRQGGSGDLDRLGAGGSSFDRLGE